MTVTDAPYQNTAIISLTCEDSMRLFDRDYSDSKLITNHPGCLQCVRSNTSIYKV